MPSTAEWVSSGSPVESTVERLRAERSTERLVLPGLSAEERANQITHGVGFVLSVWGAAQLLPVGLRADDPRIAWGCSLYVATLVLLYAASMLSHSFEHGRLRDLFRLLDQIGIYLLIAGTATPIALAYWPGWMLATLLVGTWLVALVGIVRKIAVEGPNRVTLWVYLVLGWFPAMGIGPVLAGLPPRAGAILVLGGLSYTAGTWFWLREGRVPYAHAVWHLFVLAGTAAHFAVIRWHVAVDSPLTRAVGG